MIIHINICTNNFLVISCINVYIKTIQIRDVFYSRKSKQVVNSFPMNEHYILSNIMFTLMFLIFQAPYMGKCVKFLRVYYFYFLKIQENT